MGRIKCSLCIKKTVQKVNFWPSNHSENRVFGYGQKSKFLLDFLNARLQCSQLLRNWGNIKPLYVRGRGEHRLEKAQTITVNCGGTPSRSKIKYHCRYFLMTFRKKKPKKNLVEMISILYRVQCFTAHWPILQV